MSSLCVEDEGDPVVLDGIIFLKKIFELTNTRAEPKAQNRPMIFEAETSKEHASMTPIVRGSKEIYVLLE